MIKVLTVIGARPQFIKAAPVSRVFKDTGKIKEILVHTGQHYDPTMSDIFFEQMNIPKPDYQLNMGSLAHGAMTGRMLEGIEEILIKEQPACVLVYGDTNSTLAGALTASKLHIPVIHVEAGLRSFNMKMPEEINRRLTDHVSTLLFVPTESGLENLKQEGLPLGWQEVFKSGDVMYDAMLEFEKFSSMPSVVLPERYALCTIHRAENTDNPGNLKGILEGLKYISNSLPIVFPIHPRTKKLLNDDLPDNVYALEPVGYLQMLALTKNSDLIITDSGGLQKEAYFFKKPCITVREQTEWTELVDNGYNRLVGTNSSLIREAFIYFTDEKIVFEEGLYGDGSTSTFIAEKIIEIIR